MWQQATSDRTDLKAYSVPLHPFTIIKELLNQKTPANRTFCSSSTYGEYSQTNAELMPVYFWTFFRALVLSDKQCGHSFKIL